MIAQWKLEKWIDLWCTYLMTGWHTEPCRWMEAAVKDAQSHYHCCEWIEGKSKSTQPSTCVKKAGKLFPYLDVTSWSHKKLIDLIRAEFPEDVLWGDTTIESVPENMNLKKKKKTSSQHHFLSDAINSHKLCNFHFTKQLRGNNADKRSRWMDINQHLCAGQQELVITQTHSCWYKGKGQREVMSHAASHKSSTRVEEEALFELGAQARAKSVWLVGTVAVGNRPPVVSVVDRLLKASRMPVVRGRTIFICRRI